MKSLFVSLCIGCVLVLLASSVFALEIRVAPKTLVLSSNGGNLTVHTDVPYAVADVESLVVDGTSIDPADIATYADDCGNLVAQCDKDAAKDAIGDFDGKTKTVTVTLAVTDDGAPDEASGSIRVKK